MDLCKKCAVITGAGRGIGRAVAIALAKEGVELALVSKSAEPLEDLERELGDSVRIIICADLSVEEEAISAMEKAKTALGGIDFLINCAGIGQKRDTLFSDILTEEYRRILNTNLNYVLFCTREVLPDMKRQDYGYIINILSIGAYSGKKGKAVYCASKFASRAFTESLAAECKGTGVRVSAISPGPVNTHIFARRDEPMSPESLLKMLKPEDVAEAVVFLLRLKPYVFIDNITMMPWFYD